MSRSRGQPLGAGGGLESTASKKPGPSVLQLQGNEFWQQPQGAWKWILPHSNLQMRTQPWLTPWLQRSQLVLHICAQTADPRTLWNKCVLFYDSKFVGICYTAQKANTSFLIIPVSFSLSMTFIIALYMSWVKNAVELIHIPSAEVFRRQFCLKVKNKNKEKTKEHNQWNGLKCPWRKT